MAVDATLRLALLPMTVPMTVSFLVLSMGMTVAAAAGSSRKKDTIEEKPVYIPLVRGTCRA